MLDILVRMFLNETRLYFSIHFFVDNNHNDSLNYKVV